MRQRFLSSRPIALLLSVAAVLGGFLFLLPTVHASTVFVSSDIATSTTWTANNVYVVNNAVTIDATATLTIASGTVVKFGQ